MIKVGIIGGAGYTAGELIRLLLNHPEAEIVFINSSSNAGNKITDVHEGLYGETDLTFTDQLPLDDIDVLFFCTAHGDTRKFLESHNVPEDLKIIDPYLSFIRFQYPGCHPKKCTLSCAITSNQPEHFSFSDIQRNFTDCL